MRFNKEVQWNKDLKINKNMVHLIEIAYEWNVNDASQENDNCIRNSRKLVECYSG